MGETADIAGQALKALLAQADGRERQKLNAAGAVIDKAIADTSIRDVMRRALAKVEADRRAPPSQ